MSAYQYTRQDGTTFIAASTTKRRWVILARDDQGQPLPVQPGTTYPTRADAVHHGMRRTWLAGA